MKIKVWYFQSFKLWALSVFLYVTYGLIFVGVLCSVSAELLQEQIDNGIQREKWLPTLQEGEIFPKTDPLEEEK